MFDLVLLFKCLADSTRLNSILLIHLERELCVCELTYALDETQPKISRHLAELRKNGLLSDRRQGQWVYYQLNIDLPDWVNNILDKICSANQYYLKPYLSRLNGMPERPNQCI